MESYPRQWRWLLITIFGTYFATATAPLSARDESAIDHARRIDPAGLPGRLIIAGRSLPTAAFDVFVEIAAKNRRGLLVLRADYPRSDATAAELLFKRWRPESGTPITIIDSEIDTQSDVARLVTLIEGSDSVWLAGDNPQEMHPALASPKVRRSLEQLFSDGGTIGISQTNPLGITGQINDEEKESLELMPELAVDLDSSQIENDTDESTAIFDAPNQVRIVVPASGGILLQHRHAISLGDEPSKAMLAGTPNKTAQTITMQGKHRVMDHVGLRRAALDRVGPKFPPDQPAPTRLESGTLIIVGGGGMPAGTISKFVEVAGGEEACILVLPTAMPDPLPAQNGIARSFRRAGAKEVHVLNGRTQDIVESPEYIKLFSRATGIWFGGGRQWRFVDAYLNSAVQPLMHDVLKRGGVIMGSSAGASIQAEYMARGTPIGNQDIMADGYERGLGFLPGAAIDQHFRQRDRFGDMTSLVDRYPQILGIGIDESTALIVEEEIGSVVGKGEVHFYNRRLPKPAEGPDYVSVSAGGQYNLVDRVVIEDSTEREEQPLPTASLRNPIWLIESAPQSHE